jgi:hypothetical protein
MPPRSTILPDRRDTGKASLGRESQSPGREMLLRGGLGYIGRRGLGTTRTGQLLTLEGVQQLAMQEPLELLSYLPDIVPEVGLALHQVLSLGCHQDAVRMTAIKIGSDDGEEDPAGTQILRALFDNLPDEVDGLTGALAQNVQMLLFTGLCATEAVPALSGAGIAEIWPVNSLTLRFQREEDGRLTLHQRQVGASALSGNYKPMPMERFFWASLEALPDDPYGRAEYAPVLAEALTCLAWMRDLLSAWHRVGHPRLDVDFDFEMWFKIAQLRGMTDDTEIDAWVQTKFDLARSFFDNLAPDDAFFHAKGSSVNAVGAGDKWPDVPGVWRIMRLRLIQALKANPMLMGVVEGSTETWGTISWAIYVNALERLIAKAASPLVKCANLHLRLLGLPLRAVPEFESIRTSERLTDAQAEQIEIANAARKRDEGWIKQDDASTEVTGTGAVEQEPVRPAAAPQESTRPNQGNQEKNARLWSLWPASASTGSTETETDPDKEPDATPWDERVAKEIEKVEALSA